MAGVPAARDTPIRFSFARDVGDIDQADDLAFLASFGATHREQLVGRRNTFGSLLDLSTIVVRVFRIRTP